jgi:hypothetical protein
MSWMGSSTVPTASGGAGSASAGPTATIVVWAASVTAAGVTGLLASGGWRGPAVGEVSEALLLAGVGVAAGALGVLGVLGVLPLGAGVADGATASAEMALATGLEGLARSFARSLARSAPLRCAFAPPSPSVPSPASSFDALPWGPALGAAEVDDDDGADEGDLVAVGAVEFDVVEGEVVEFDVVEVDAVDIVLVDEVVFDVDRDGDAGRAERGAGDDDREVEPAPAEDPPRAAGGAFFPAVVEVSAAGGRRFGADREADVDAFDPFPAEAFPADEVCAARPGGAASAPTTPTVAVRPSAARTVARTATARNPPPAVVTRTFFPCSVPSASRGRRRPGYRPSRRPG